MNDLESRVRDELQSLGAQVRPRVDLGAVRAAGDRLRRSRRYAWAAAVAAVSVVGALGASAVLAGGPSGPVVIATPAPAPTGAPTPSASPSVTAASGPVTALEVPLSSTQTITLRATPAGEGYDVVTDLSGIGPGMQEVRGQATVERPAVFRITASEWVLVTVGGLAWVEGSRVGTEGNDNTWSEEERFTFPGLDARAVVLTVGNISVDEAATLTGALWANAAGVVRDHDGRVVPHASLRLDGRRFSFVHDADLGLACSAEVVDGKVLLELCWNLGAQMTADPAPILVSAGCGERDGPCHGGHAEGYGYLILPEDSREGITVDPVKGATCAVAQGPIGETARLAYMVRCTGDVNDQGESIDAVHYRDATGATRVWRS